MHTTLKSRMAAVEAMLKTLEDEKLAKEEHAQKALAEQEALMEKVVWESRILQQEANENSKVTNHSCMCRGGSKKSHF